MDIEKIVYEVYDFEDLKREISESANKTLEEIEKKGKEEEFITLLNEIIGVDAENGKPMTLNELDDFIDYETTFFEEQLNCKFWEED